MQALIGWNWSRDTKSDDGYQTISAVLCDILRFILRQRPGNEQALKLNLIGIYQSLLLPVVGVSGAKAVVVVVAAVALGDKMIGVLSTAVALPNTTNCSSFVPLTSVNFSTIVLFVEFADGSKIMSKSNPTLPLKICLILMPTKRGNVLLQNSTMMKVISCIKPRDLGELRSL